MRDCISPRPREEPPLRVLGRACRCKLREDGTKNGQQPLATGPEAEQSRGLGPETGLPSAGEMREPMGEPPKGTRTVTTDTCSYLFLHLHVYICPSRPRAEPPHFPSLYHGWLFFYFSYLFLWSTTYLLFSLIIFYLSLSASPYPSSISPSKNNATRLFRVHVFKILFLGGVPMFLNTFKWKCVMDVIIFILFTKHLERSSYCLGASDHFFESCMTFPGVSTAPVMAAQNEGCPSTQDRAAPLDLRGSGHMRNWPWGGGTQ